MKDIAIYGAGGLGREVASMINLINEKHPDAWNLIGFFDDGEEKGKQVSHFGKVLGKMEDLNAWETELNVVLCMGSPKFLKLVRDKITNPNICFPNLIHPDFVTLDASTFSIGEGNIIKGYCSVACNVRIGNFNILNGSISVGHDSILGNYNVVMPGVKLAGGIQVGNCNLFGANSFVLQKLKINHGVKLAPCSALMHKPKNDSEYIGVPAKIFKF